MLPIGPLMIEHRLIERMIAVIRREGLRVEREGDINPGFIDHAVDFIRTYADRCHHGKEEDILFRHLARRRLSDEHRRVMEELIEEHRMGRKKTGELSDANERHAAGDKDALARISECLSFLADFYPRHIEKEDKRFFVSCMDYFSDAEKDAVLKEELDFDRSLIHRLYKEKVERAEQNLLVPAMRP